MPDDEKDQHERQLASKQPKGEKAGEFSVRPVAENVVIQTLTMAPQKPREKD